MKKKYFISFAIIILLLIIFGVIEGVIVRDKETEELAISENMIESYEEISEENLIENNIELKEVETIVSEEHTEVDITNKPVSKQEKEEKQEEKNETVEKVISNSKSSNENNSEEKEEKVEQKDLQSSIKNDEIKHTNVSNSNHNSNTNVINQDEKLNDSNKMNTEDKKIKHVHSDVGTMGKWFSSYDELVAAYNEECDKWVKLYRNNEITKEEFEKNCPFGYTDVHDCYSYLRGKSNSNCGLITGDYIYK